MIEVARCHLKYFKHLVRCDRQAGWGCWQQLWRRVSQRMGLELRLGKGLGVSNRVGEGLGLGGRCK